MGKDIEIDAYNKAELSHEELFQHLNDEMEFLTDELNSMYQRQPTQQLLKLLESLERVEMTHEKLKKADLS